MSQVIVKTRDGQELEVGMTESTSILITEITVEKAVNLSEDTNTLHSKIESAREVGLEKCPIHGFAIYGFISALIGTKLPGDKSMGLEFGRVKFARPVYVGSTVDIIVKLTRVNRRGFAWFDVFVTTEGEPVFTTDTMVSFPV